MEAIEGDKHWEHLHARLQGIARRRGALDAEEAACLREAEATQLWRRLGYVHIGEYLERELGYSPKVAADRLRVARELADLPLMMASLAEGMHYSAVRELTRVATRDTERAWLEAMRGKNLRQIEAAVAGRKKGALPDDPADPSLVKRVVRFELSPQVVALLRQTTAALAAELGHAIDDDLLFETLCRRALGGAQEASKPAYQVAVTVCRDCKRGWQTAAGREVEVSAATIERAMCDAEELGALDAEAPQRAVSTIPPRTRKQVLARDKGCTVPGCRASTNIDVHHIKRRADGGGHEPANLTVLCSGHHQLLHDGLLAMTGRAPDKLEFRWTRSQADPIGTVLAQDADRPRPPSPAASPRLEESSVSAIAKDARSALVNLGFRPADARLAVERALPAIESEPTLEAVIRAALQCCRRRQC